MRSYLLLGGAGFLGSNLAWTLAMAGARVFVFERPAADLRRLARLDRQVKVITGTLSDTDSVMSVIAEHHIDTVVHLVSGLLPASGFIEYQQELSLVIAATIALFRRCSKVGVRVVFFSSGGAIYGDSLGEKLSEKHPLAPISYYGFSKLQIEEYIQFEHRRTGLEFLIVRPSNPYGRFQSPEGNQGLIAIAFGRLRKALPIEVWGDGSVVRDYIDVEDLMHAVFGLLESGVANAIFNVGSGSGASVIDVIKMVEESSGLKANIRFTSARDVDVQSVVLDIENLRRVIDFEPIDLRSGIRKFCGTWGG